MRIETNEDLVNRNRKIANYMMLFTFVGLIGAFIVMNGDAFGITVISQEAYLGITVPVLAIILMATLFSVRMTNQWVRQPRPEDALAFGLKGLSNKSVLYNYLHLPAKHVLISPQGVFVITTRFQDGKFEINDDNWRARKSPLSALFSIFRMDGIGDPIGEAKIATEHIQEYFDEIDAEIKVKPLIVFVDPRATLEVGTTSIPVLHADPKSHLSIKEFLRKIPKEQRRQLTDEEIKAFEEATIEYEYE